MNSIARILLPAVVASTLALGSAQPDSPTGAIVGRVTDARCGIPVPFANVLIGKDGAITNREGRFRVDSLPVGNKRLRISMMGYDLVDDTIRVVAGDSVRADFVIRNRHDNTIFSPKPHLLTDACPEHGVPMQSVLAATSDALHVVDPDDQRLFPKAWVYVYKDARSPKVFWVQGCPVCSEGWNDRHSGHRWKPLPETVPSAWGEYRREGVVEFRAPGDLTANAVEDSCRLAATWKGDNVAVDLRRVPIWYSRPRGNYGALDVVGDCKAAIGVAETGQGVRVTAMLVSTTNSIDQTVIEIATQGSEALETARMILSTVRFPGPTRDVAPVDW